MFQMLFVMVVWIAGLSSMCPQVSRSLRVINSHLFLFPLASVFNKEVATNLLVGVFKNV